jgi:hypothetical protein
VTNTEDDYFVAADEPQIAMIGPTTYLSLSGEGAPGSDDFYAKKEALTLVSEGLGLAGPIEIIYWFDPEHGDVGIAGFYWTVPLEHLRWRILVRVPDGTELPPSSSAIAGLEMARQHGLALFTMQEGKVVQVMHHGPFGDEDKTLARLGMFADSHELRRNGPHHEIHLDAFGRGTPQTNLKTILRDPVGSA